MLLIGRITTLFLSLAYLSVLLRHGKVHSQFLARTTTCSRYHPGSNRSLNVLRAHAYTYNTCHSMTRRSSKYIFFRPSEACDVVRGAEQACWEHAYVMRDRKANHLWSSCETVTLSIAPRSSSLTMKLSVRPLTKFFSPSASTFFAGYFQLGLTCKLCGFV